MEHNSQPQNPHENYKRTLDYFLCICAFLTVGLESAHYMDNTPGPDSCPSDFSPQMVEFWNRDGKQCNPQQRSELFNTLAFCVSGVFARALLERAKFYSDSDCEAMVSNRIFGELSLQQIMQKMTENNNWRRFV
jgi:hypothetical protein